MDNHRDQISVRDLPTLPSRPLLVSHPVRRSTSPHFRGATFTRRLAAFALAIGVAGYALTANAFLAGQPGGSGKGAYSSQQSPTQNQSGNHDWSEGAARKQWRDNLPGWARELMNNPYSMDRHGSVGGGGYGGNSHNARSRAAEGNGGPNY